MKIIYSQRIISQTRKNFFPVIDTKGMCILEDALNIWSKFEKQASLMKDKLYAPHDTFLTQEDYSIHRAWVNGEETEISRERFFSVLELLQAILHHHSSFNYGDNYLEIKDVYDSVLLQKRDVRILVHLQQGEAEKDSNMAIQLNVDYSEDTENKAGLPAPITLIPYKLIQQGLIEQVKLAFSNWTEDEKDPDYLIRDYSAHNLKSIPTLPVSAYVIKECCKELDKNFNLDYTFDTESHIERIKKDDLERAKFAFISLKTLRSEPIKEYKGQLFTFLASNKRGIKLEGKDTKYQFPRELENIVCENIIGYSFNK